MRGEIELGKCGICGKEKQLTRTYFRYPNMKCECHSPCHFDLIIHCRDCVPVRPRETKVLLRTDLLL